MSSIPRPLFPSFQRAPSVASSPPIAQRTPTNDDGIVEYRREYVALGCDFHRDMTLVEYYGLILRNCPKELQRGGPQQQQGIHHRVSAGGCGSDRYIGDEADHAIHRRTHRAFERMGEGIQASHFEGCHPSHSRSGRLNAKE
jgi:hypothetical protein